MIRTTLQSALCLVLSSYLFAQQPAPRPDALKAFPDTHDKPSQRADDWNRVRDLAHDEEINVWASHNRHVRCLFTGATDDALFCEGAYSRWHDSVGEYRFSRLDVDKIRLEQSQRNLKTTIIATGVAGAAAGAALTDTKDSGQRVLGGLAGGLAGTMAGLVIGVPIGIFVPGKLVYERPHSRRMTHDHALKPQPSQPAQEAQ